MTANFSPREVLQNLVANAQNPRFIGTPFRMPGNESNSFGIRCGDGYAVVFGAEYDGDPVWWLRIAAGIALDVPDIDGALHWVNEENRGIYTGCYTCAIDQTRNLAAVVHQVSFSNIEINADSELVFNFMIKMMTLVSNRAATKPAEFIKRYGGIPFNQEFAVAIPMLIM
jgi:hypothetical protein